MTDQIEEFRRVLGHFATGVTIVTGTDRSGAPVGLTANAMASVSLRPPLVLVCLDQGSASLAAILETERFGVSILEGRHEALARRFSADVRGERFRELELRRSPGGVPLIPDALAWLDCVLWKSVEAGDHMVLFGEVQSSSADENGVPLLFFRGEYGIFAP
jgi:flavin reductase (DIM6/NTAB) family NADH-FMN oxidoreductase RutF